jgi:glycosyltransferase involved in cell wall biosynthesis
MKIAIAGIRGIPANYGGFETFAEELSSRLVQSGFEVRVYCRSHCYATRPSEFGGASLVYLPTIQHKYLDTIVHTLLCLLHLVLYPVECLLVCNAANSPLIWIARLRGIPVIVNVDGVERKRAKWNALGRAWYRVGELCSVWFASRIVADAACIKDYYLSSYGADSTVIPYGFRESLAAEIEAKIEQNSFNLNTKIYNDLGVEPGKYLLYVGRLEPENNAHIVIRAYREGCSEFPLIIVGDAPYAGEYIDMLKRESVQGVIFAGFRFGEDYEALQLGARVYIQAGEVGGTHPALVEAMGFGNAIIANDTPEHREVLQETGLFYSKNNVSELSLELRNLSRDQPRIGEMRRAARKRAQSAYSWEGIVGMYTALFRQCTERKR